MNETGWIVSVVRPVKHVITEMMNFSALFLLGNHDVTLDTDFYAKHGSSFHWQNTQDPNECIQIVTGSSPSVVFLQHQTAIVQLTRATGPRTIFKIFGSPFSQFKGNWAFGYDSADARALWSQIPHDTDIVVTHTPPYSHCDRNADGHPVGCKVLRMALGTVKPLLAVCGHVHESRGYERIRWGSSSPGNGSQHPLKLQTTPGTLPPMGSKKQNLIDLTGKKGEGLDNDGFAIRNVPDFLSSLESPSQSILILPSASSQSSSPPDNKDEVQDRQNGCINNPMQQEIQSRRRETCLVNAAIVATSWPFKGGKRFNAPIVVDLNLPVWGEVNGG